MRSHPRTQYTKGVEGYVDEGERVGRGDQLCTQRREEEP
jgi:hypothetical protein